MPDITGLKIIYSLSWFRSPASGYESPRAGTSQGIFFDTFIPSVIRAFRVAFRDWELWIQHDDRVKGLSSWPLVDRCARAGLLKLFNCGPIDTLCGSMLRRINPLKDASVDWVVCRDIDSLPMHRDRKMVEAAIASGAVVHAILDSESHSGPLMGGMTAWHSSTAAAILHSNKTGIDFDIHGADQRYLNREVWPLVKSKTLIHQRRRDIQYPDAMKTLPVAPQETVLDGIVRHIGAGYDTEKAMKAMRDHHPDEILDMVEARRWPDHPLSKWDEPWYTRDAIIYLETYVKPGMRVLEYGGGGSTVWYSRRVGEVVTVETNPLWRTLLEEQHLTNVTLATSHVVVSDRDCPYFDVVVVDDSHRIECLAASKPLVKPGGLMVLDNSEEHPGARELFQGWEEIDTASGSWYTTIWKRPS